MLKKLAAIALAMLLLLLPCGCTPKAMTVPEEFAVLAAASNTVAAGGTFTVTVPAPVESTDCTVTVASNNVAASLRGSQLAITGLQAGTDLVSLSFITKGYEPLTLTLPVTVVWPQLEVTALAQSLGVTGKLAEVHAVALPRDSADELTLGCLEHDLMIQATSSNEAVLTVKVDGSKLLLTALAPGQATLTVTVKKDRFADTVAAIAVTVTAVPVKLEAAKEPESPYLLEQGAAAQLAFVTGGTLSVAVDNANVEAVVSDDGKLICFTGKAVGSSVATVTAKQEGYLDNTLTLNLTVTPPAPPPLPKEELPKEEAPKEEAGWTATGDYADLINDIVAGTNKERAAAGLPPLVLLKSVCPAAAIRAKEAATLWSHTRPDGRRCHTVLADFGITRYQSVGENLASADYVETGAQVVARWMASPGHRKAILTKNFTGLGVGVYYDGEFYYYCQTFVGDSI